MVTTPSGIAPKSQGPATLPAALADTLREAVAHHQRGELAKAEARYRAVLAQAPRHFDALHMLGVVHHQQGRHEEAAALIRQAIAIDSQRAAAHSNLGLALHKARRYEEALAAHDRAVALKPDDANAHYNRGNTLRALQRGQEALASYDRSLALKPDRVHVLCNRGNVLRMLRRPQEAIASYDRALAVAPDDADALYHRGNALQGMGRGLDALADYDRLLALQPEDPNAWYRRGNALLGLARHEEALASFDRALAHKHDHIAALNNRGIALLGLNRHADALASYDRALEREPDNAEVLNNRGNVLQALRRSDEALLCYDLALAHKAGYPDPLINRGNVLRDLGRHTDALASYDQALAIAPNNVEALANRGHALRETGRADKAAQCFARLVAIAPDYPYAAGHLLYARMSCCDWTDHASTVDAIDRDVRARRKSAEPFGYLAAARSPRDLRLAAETYASDRYPAAAAPLWTGTRHDHPRIRVGYVSGEFRHQATAILMAELFERHDRERFELYAFDNGWNDHSALRARIEQAFENVIGIAGTGDREAATMIRDLQIDILVNLNGYFGKARQGIFAHRPCPIQVNYLGFPGTIGAPYIDYIVADATVIPPQDDDCYVEQVVRLPDSYQVNDARRAIAAEGPSRAAAGLPATGFVFCSFNNNFKITPDVFAVWLRLLARVDGSVLWLLEDNAAAARNLRREAAQRGVAPARIVFAPRVDLDQHLARHRHADLFLDTLPCNAHTTASDALWAGLPVLTCAGATFAGRVAASLLEAMGLPELVTTRLDEYEATAHMLATSPARLAAIRATLARNRTTHPLFDTDRFRRHLEAAYAGMWERHRAGLPPAAFDVAPLTPLVSPPV